ncbi:MAG: hypothetical protein GX883_07455 [Firmicutes bacterium]|nr:hypothetical protein [Bacillota bacterium]
MIAMLFGVSNVGKTTTGKKLAEKLGYTFIDLDDEIKNKFQTTLEIFTNEHPFSLERAKIKGEILKELISRHQEKLVIAVSPIYYAQHFNNLLELNGVTAIELCDTAEHIFQRLVFSDENDVIYRDDAYKEEHRDYYMNDIHDDIAHAKQLFRKIKKKYFIDNQPVDKVVEGVLALIKDSERSSLSP